ncbi:MAG: hypothetical protein Q9214_004701, partial [Letrouitia sp. 1 TL-2023]
ALADSAQEEIMGRGRKKPLTTSVRTTVGIQGTTAFKASKHTANHAVRQTKASEGYLAFRAKWLELTADDCNQAIDNYLKFRKASQGLTVCDERLLGGKLLTTMKNEIQTSCFSDLARMLKRCSSDKEFANNGQRGRIYLLEALQTLDPMEIMKHKSILNLLATRQTALFLFELMRDVAWQRSQEPEGIDRSEWFSDPSPVSYFTASVLARALIVFRECQCFSVSGASAHKASESPIEATRRTRGQNPYIAFAMHWSISCLFPLTFLILHPIVIQQALSAPGPEPEPEPEPTAALSNLATPPRYDFIRYPASPTLMLEIHLDETEHLQPSHVHAVISGALREARRRNRDALVAGTFRHSVAHLGFGITGGVFSNELRYQDVLTVLNGLERFYNERRRYLALPTIYINRVAIWEKPVGDAYLKPLNAIAEAGGNNETTTALEGARDDRGLAA